jgi:P4 family phage/plasmid primase-like protien
MSEKEELYMEFGKGQKQECIRYCETNNLAFFQRDLNSSSSKIFIATSYRNIWDRIKSAGVIKSHYYESWNASQPMRLYIDYDKKNDNVEGTLPSNEGFVKGSHNENGNTNLKNRIKKLDENPNSHKTDILNIINTIRELLPNITGVNIIKSIPDIEKKSYHIVFDGLHFPKAKSIQVWLEEQLKPKFKDLFDKKIIDTKVYSPICMRTLLSTKAGQNRPLYLLETDAFLTELQELPITADETSYEQFLRTCITNIEPDSILFNYKTEKKKDNSKKVHLMNDEDIYSDKEVVRKYLDILDPDRFTDRNKWLAVGYILRSINPEYIDLWHYFSSKWENYDENQANVTWDSLNSEYIYTIENLKYLAKIDNPEDYAELTKEIPNHDIKYLRPFDNVLSKLIHRLYSEQFVCSDCEHSVWYYFNGIRWKKENKSYNLRVKIINEVFTKIENYRRQLIKEGASDEIIKNYHNILSKLGSGIKLNCLELEFYNSNFDKIIDQNKDLLGFENGVYDLIEGQFRKGRSSDYISLSTGYEFIEYSPDHPLYIELFDLICKILPEPEVREFTLKSLASCLDGHNRDENFYIWSGKNASGGNGKSTIMDLHLKALGEYACISPVSLITGKRENASSANSALAAIRNKRCVIMQEPAATDQIQVDTMKALTGGDRISTRELNSSQIEFKPCAKIFMATNKLPGLSDSDGGTIRRLKITEFVSRFVENPNPDNLKRGIYEFKIDKELKSKLEHYDCVFMNILLNYYRLYKDESLKPPEAVIKVTKKFEADNNIIKQFIDENIVQGTSKDFITRDEIKGLFSKEYALKSHFGKLSNFITQLENTLCVEMKLDSKKRIPKINGFYIRGPEMDDEEEEMEGTVEESTNSLD